MKVFKYKFHNPIFYNRKIGVTGFHTTPKVLLRQN